MDDIYGDLHNYDDFGNLETLKSENKELKLKLDEYQVSMCKLKKDLDILGEKHARLLENFSTLLKTAKAEIERKTSIITILNKEKDELVLRMRTGQNKYTKNKQINKVQNQDKNQKTNSSKSSYTERSHSTDSANHRLKETERPKLNGHHTETRVNSSTKDKNTKGTDNLTEKENLDNNFKSSRIMNRRKSTGLINSRYSSDEDGEIFDDSDHNSSRSKRHIKQTGYTDYQYLDDRTRSSRYDRFHKESDKGNQRSWDSRKHNDHRSGPEKSYDNHSNSRYSSRYKRKESPSRSKYARTKSTDRRHHSRDKERYDKDKNKNIQEKEAVKQKLPPTEEAPACKRQRLDSNSRLKEISNNELFELSCRSPDYVEGLTNFVQEPVKEIKFNKVESLQDPRENSERYHKTVDKNSKQCLVSASGKNVDLIVLDWSEKPQEMEEGEANFAANHNGIEDKLVQDFNDFRQSIVDQKAEKLCDNEKNTKHDVNDLYANIAEPTFSNDEASDIDYDDVGDELLFGHNSPSEQTHSQQATEPECVLSIESNTKESSENVTKYRIPKKSHTKGADTKTNRKSPQQVSCKTKQTDNIQTCNKMVNIDNKITVIDNCIKETISEKIKPTEDSEILLQRKFEGTVESDLQLSDENSDNSCNEKETVKINNKKQRKSSKSKGKKEKKIESNTKKEQDKHVKNNKNLKFSELFGDSSLITPDDLGIPAKTPTATFENHSEESNEIYWSLLGDSGRSNSVQNITDNAICDSAPNNKDDNRTSKESTQDNTTKQSNGLNAEQNIKNCDESNEINPGKISKTENVVIAKPEFRRSIFETPIKCVATSTPQRECTQTSLPDISSSSTDSRQISISNSEPRVDGDAPDIKIVIKRKKKFAKKVPTR